MNDADLNAGLAAPVDLIIGIRSCDAQLVAASLLEGAATHDIDARELLLRCLDGTDFATEIVRPRRRGDRHVELRLAVSGDWLGSGIPDNVIAIISNKLRTGELVIRDRKADGRRGPRPQIFTDQIALGSRVEELAIMWSVRVHRLDREALRKREVAMPRGAWRAALDVMATLTTRSSDAERNENRDFQVREMRRALRAWQHLTRRL